MKTSIINKLAALLTASGLSLTAPLTVTAQPVNRPTNIDLIAGGTYYSRTANAHAVTINDGSTKTGTNNVLYSGATGAHGLYVGGTDSVFIGKNITIYTGITLNTSGYALDSGGSITSDPSKFVSSNIYSANAVYIINGGYVEIDSLTAVVNSRPENGGTGVQLISGTLIARNLDLTVNSGEGGRLLYSRNGSLVEVQSGTMKAPGGTATGLDAQQGNIKVANVTVDVSAGNSTAVIGNGAEVTVVDSVLISHGRIYRGQNGGLIQAAGVLASGSGDGVWLSSGSDTRVIIEGGSLHVQKDLVMTNGTAAGAVSFDEVAISHGGNLINARDGSAPEVTFSGMAVSGSVVGSGSSASTLNLNHSTLTGVSELTENATLTVNLDNNAAWNLTGSSNVTTLNNSGTVVIANAYGEDLNVSGAFTQDADGTLDLTISGTGPIINAGTVSLGGTLTISGFSGTVTTKASLLTSQDFTVIRTTDGISGDFDAIDLGTAGSPVDYVTDNHCVTNSGLDYTLGFGLSWFASGTNSHGNFTLNNSGMFEVDVVLSNTTADSAKNWDGESLTKLGDGTLLLSATNTYTGTTNVSAGTLRAGAANVIASSTALNVNGVFDLNNFSQLVNNLSGSGTVTLGTATLTVNESNHTSYSGLITGDGALIKNNTGTLTLSGSSDFTGGALINSGEIYLTNLSGLGSGTVSIENLASLRLGASGTFFNNITASSGTTIIDSGASVTISGTNTLFTSTAPTVINGALFVPATGNFVYQNALTGTGALTVNNSGAFDFAASTGANFTGTVALENNTFALTASNALPLTNSTLVTGSGNLAVVDSDPAATSRNIGGLSFSGGTIRFEGYDPHATRADTIITVTDRVLNVSGGGTVEVVVPNPSQIPDGSKFTHVPLLQQDEGISLTQLVSATHGVTGDPSVTLQLRDDNGRVISDSYTLNLSHDGITPDAIGTYDYGLNSGTANDGLYIAFQLKQVDIQANRTLTLDQDTPTPAEGDDFSATIIGAGNLNISAASSITLNGTGNSYSGTTTITSGTLIVGADYNMFASSTAFVINSGAALNTGGFDQQVNNLSGSGLATFTDNTLTVNNTTNTNFTGTLSGGKLVKDGGAQLNANDAVANLTQVQVENGEIILGQNTTVSASNNPAVIANGGTATFNSSTLSTSGSVLILAKDNSPAMVNLNNMTVNVRGSGHLVEIDKGALTVNLNNTNATGDISAFNGSTGLVNLTNNSVLTGRIDPVSVSIDHSTWNMTGRSRITTLHGANGGTITIDNVEGEDLTVSSGITGQTALNLTLSDSVKGQQEIWVVVDETNNMSNSAFTLSHEVSYGMYQYNLVNNSDGAWLVYTGSSGTIPPVNPPTISDEGDTIINTAAAVSAFWFTQLDNLHKRMGELRYNKPANADALDNIWVRAYGQQINANTGITSVKGFAETQYGVDLGTDYLWKLDADNQLYTGIFAGYGDADRDFHSNYSGSTDSGYGGVYVTWLNKDGWYADVVAKGQYFRNDFTGEDHAEYDSVGAGISLEVGNMFEFKDGWFVEPSAQFSYLHLMNDNYTTRDGLHVDLTDADVLHLYGGARFGRNIKLSNSGMLQPYIKAGGLGQISRGNKLTVSGDHWRPNLDGARAVVGAGLIWQLDADSQLHLDYEASFGEKYDKPWGVNLGYRYQF